MTSAFIIDMKIPLAKWNHMAKPKVTGERQRIPIPVGGW